MHRRAGLALLAALLALPAGCGGAGDGEGRQAGLWGVVPQERTTAAQLKRLRAGGVTGVRIVVHWPSVQPRRDGRPRWAAVDGIVADAARTGMEVLPFVYASPPWVAADERTLPVQSAAQRRAWSRFLRELVGRYGPRGELWEARPGLPRRPIRTWQIWNEPNFFYFAWPPDPAEYGELVGLSHGALAATDPGAELVLGGMFALPAEQPPRAYPAHRFLTLLHKQDPGIKRIVDGVALHPYTRDTRYLEPTVNLTRAALRRVGNPDTELWITELGWGSQSGPGATPLEQGLRGQARRLEAAWRVLERNRERWRLRRAFWFAATDTRSPDACDFCDSAGLFTADFRPKPAWRAFTRLSGNRAGRVMLLP